MTDDPPKKASDRFAGWKKAAQKGQISGVGDSDDVLKKAVALNPQIKGDKSTQEFFKAVDDARKGAKQPSTTPVANVKIALISDPATLPRMDAKDLMQIVQATRLWQTDENKRIVDAQARAKSDAKLLDEAQQQLILQTRSKLIALLAAVDPNLLSPKTTALLETHGKFLQTLGFKREMMKS